MDPLWAAVAEFWWIGPSVIGAGAIGWLGLRHERAERLRRIELDAARIELKSSRRDAASARVAVRVARTELARVQAERGTGRATTADVAAARKALDRAQREAKSAAAAVRVRRAHVSAARTALPAAAADPAAQPLARLLAAHDAVTARWMEYETDPARLIAFSTMTDARHPLTGRFLSAQRAALDLRPASPQTRLSAAEFAAYRDAVAHVAHAFEAAESDAWRRARVAGDVPATPQEGDPDAAAPSPLSQWGSAAQDFAQGLAQTVFARSTEAFARANAARPASARPASARTPSPPDSPTTHADPTQTAASAPPERPSASAGRSGQRDGERAEQPREARTHPQPAPRPATTPVWPVPSRTQRRPES